MLRVECRLCLWKSLIRKIEVAEKNMSSTKVRVHMSWVVCKDREIRAQLCQQIGITLFREAPRLVAITCLIALDTLLIRRFIWVDMMANVEGARSQVQVTGRKFCEEPMLSIFIAHFVTALLA